MTRVRLSAFLGAAVLAAACGDDPTQPRAESVQQESFDVATVVGDAVAEDVSLIRMHEGAFGVPTFDASFTGEWRNDCTYSPTTGRFTCPVRTRDGRTISRSYQLLDASGRPQAAYDPVTTASANFVSTISGSVARGGFSATFSRQRNITVTGLAGSETQHTINGTGSSSTTRSRHTADGVTRSYSMTSTDAIVNVVIAFPRTQGSWPLSGTITRQVTFSGQSTAGHARSGTRTATVTFNGTQFVPLVVGDRTFTLDLATGKISRPAGAS
jgi:hypothetical protein